MGSDPDVLFSYETLKNELKLCGNFAIIIVPMLIQICAVDPEDVTNLNEICGDEDQQQVDVIQGFSKDAQALYDKRINELLEDLTEFEYYRKLNNSE